MTKINIENAVRNSGAERMYQFSLQELIRHLKELRDRTDAGDMGALTEFFQLYRFDDNEQADR